jgi:hypothetical protein
MQHWMQVVTWCWCAITALVHWKCWLHWSSAVEFPEQRRFEAMKGKFRHSWTSLHSDENWKMVSARIGVGAVA